MRVENIEEKAKDDQDFLYNYGSIRSRTPSTNYRNNYDLIFRKKEYLTDRVNTVDTDISGELE